MAAWGRSIAAWARAAVGPDTSGTADGELLARFALNRDPAAFELIVWRHGGMVLRTALAVTRDHHAAEDVTQATFLVLAKRAGSLRHGDALAGFLHTTARRIAVRAASRRRTVSLPEGLAASPVQLDDVSAAVHEEVARLPEVWRVPVLLCFFEGLTHAEAAERLGKPVGSVAGWIARAKARLEDRLTRRGVTLPAAGLASLLAVGPADAKFVAAVAGSAMAYVGGSLVSSPVVLQLVRGAYRAMILAKLKVAATAGVIALGGAGLTLGGWAYTTAQVPSGAPVAAKPALPLTPAAKPEEPRKVTLAQVQRSLANLKKLQGGMLNYEAATQYLPTDIVNTDKTEGALLSWRVAILPYIGEEKLYARFRLDQPWDSESNLKLLAKMPDCFRVGFEAKDSKHTYYQVINADTAALFSIRTDRSPRGVGGEGVGGPGGYPGGPPGGSAGIPRPGGGFQSAPPRYLAETKGHMPGGGGLGSAGGQASGGSGRYSSTRPMIEDITDGTENTIGIVECGPPVPWTKPADVILSNLRWEPLPQLAWPFQGVFHVSMMDGKSQAIAQTMPEKYVRAMFTAAGAETEELEDSVRSKHTLQYMGAMSDEKALLEQLNLELAQTSHSIEVARAKFNRMLETKTKDDFIAIQQALESQKRQLKSLLKQIEELNAMKK